MPRLHRYVGEFSGAFADLGTFLPIVLGVLTLQHIDPSGLFIGFGFFALFTALIYRRPVPVQPMKVVAAIVITTHLDAATVAATGVLLGLVLLLLAVLGVINGIAKKIPQTVLSGIQLGLGLTLAWAGFQLIMDEWMIGIIALLLLIILQQTRLKSFTVLLVVIGISCWSIISGDHALPQIKLDIYLPSLISFGWDEIQTSALILLLPQLALTLTNAVVVTAAIASDLFPSDTDRISPNRLAITTGALNFCLAPIGAFPMCHGAGGLVVQHRFGARSGLAPAIFGITCLSLGLFMGPDAMKLLSLLPLAALGALLMLAGLQLAKSQSLFQANGWELFVLVTTGVSCVIINVAAGLLIGLLMEMMRNRIRKT
ncbi:MAG: putative sulfate/molybdate transporter [Candidatus Thiodiazotropha sp. (ex Semelilucina semeliformis)]|nr:putative sulfate/molybdate transporter [Candidatus Thiodiazotropha sp. (ex Semelilucina semeliformis)]MCU7829523.1 putative sulfate/molybdate transporter [Candidatus Thiodiazotropha sp. (ex Myrtea sp. 'scaly one' KF741663)]